VGFLGISRPDAAGYDKLSTTMSGTTTVTSQTPVDGNILVFTNGDTDRQTDARLRMYTAGEHITLATTRTIQDAFVADVAQEAS
jgi:hypothetical protein